MLRAEPVDPRWQWLTFVDRAPPLGQVVADFVGAIREGWLQRCCSASLPGGAVLDDVAVLFQTMPQTTSAFALWLVKLDSLVAPPHLRQLHGPAAPPTSAPAKSRPLSLSLYC